MCFEKSKTPKRAQRVHITRSHSRDFSVKGALDGLKTLKNKIRGIESLSNKDRDRTLSKSVNKGRNLQSNTPSSRIQTSNKLSQSRNDRLGLSNPKENQTPRVMRDYSSPTLKSLRADRVEQTIPLQPSMVNRNGNHNYSQYLKDKSSYGGKIVARLQKNSISRNQDQSQSLIRSLIIKPDRPQERKTPTRYLISTPREQREQTMYFGPTSRSLSPFSTTSKRRTIYLTGFRAIKKLIPL